MWIPHLSIEDAIAKYALGQKSFAQNVFVDFLAELNHSKITKNVDNKFSFDWHQKSENLKVSVTNQPTKRQE